MQIILDSKHMDELHEMAELGIVDGATASESLLANSDHGEYQDLVHQVCYEVQGPVLAEVAARDASSMAHEATQMMQWSPYLVISIPMGVEGLKALRQLENSHADPETICEGCDWLGKCETPLVKARRIVSERPSPVNVTQVSSAGQALLAAKAGATYVSPGGAESGKDNQELIRITSEIRAALDNSGFDARVLATGICTPDEMVELAVLGCHAQVVPYAVLAETLRPAPADEKAPPSMDAWQPTERP